MEQELFSRLPEELIHRILGLLTTKNAFKASLASKLLQASWLSSCPVLDFSREDDQALFKQKLKRFLKYVSNTMDMVSNHSITSFKFQTPYVADTELVSALLLDKWIRIALDCHVGEIRVNVVRGVPYCLPQRVLSSSFLKSLSLFRGDSELLQPLGGPATVIINLPCLQSLNLFSVCIDEEALERLLKGCPSLEHLMLMTATERLSQLNISHRKLKSLNVSHIFGSGLVKVEVEAPCLEKFHYSGDTADLILKNSASKNLKCLSLSSRSSQEWLSKLLPKCTSLETLKLGCHVKMTFKISNPYVKNITINYQSFAEIEIDCPMLNSLCWTTYDSIIVHGGKLLPLLPSVSVINRQPNFAGHLSMTYLSHSHTDLNTAWFHKLREFLLKSRMATMSLLLSHSGEEADQNGDNESLPTSAVKIKQLYLMVGSGLPESCYSFIMNGFLSTCHPDTIHLATPWTELGEKPIHFIEFVRKKLENWKDAYGCYCSSKIKCWKHQLKKVEVQEFSNISKSDLPMLFKPPGFHLKFQWG